MNQCDNLQNVQMAKGSSDNIVTEKESKHNPGARLWMCTVICPCEWEHLLFFFFFLIRKKKTFVSSVMTYRIAKTVLICSGKYITSGTVAAIEMAAWLTCVVHCNPPWSLDCSEVPIGDHHSLSFKILKVALIFAISLRFCCGLNCIPKKTY